MPLPFIAWLFIGVVAVIAGYAILASMMPEQEGQDYKDFEVPTADPSRPIPWVAGTVEVSGLSVLWWGDKRIRKQSGSKKRAPATFFNASLIYGICHGPIDAFLGMKLKDQIIFPPSQVIADGNSGGGSSGGMFSDYSRILRELVERGQQPDVGKIDMREAMPNIPNLAEKLNGEQSFGELVASSNEIKTGSSSFPTNYPKIFGGKDSGGGIGGGIEVTMGGWNQVLSAKAKERIRVNSFPQDYIDLGIEVPNFRGIATAYMAGDPGFWFGRNDPNLPAAKIRVMRIPRAGLHLDDVVSFDDKEQQVKAIVPEKTDTFWRFPQANPAAAIYELLTDTDVGGGYRSSEIDLVSFTHCARILSRERMGLGILWTRQNKVGEIIKKIGEIVSGVVFLDPITGLVTMRLLRSDADLKVFRKYGWEYSEDSMWHASNFTPLRSDLHFTDANAKLLESSATTYATTTTHLTVKFKNDVTEEDTSIVEINDGALVRSDGLSNEDERDYSFIRSPEVARFVAQRELKQRSKPTIQVKLEIGPIARTIRPYDVVTLGMSDPSVPAGRYRVTKVPYGGTQEDEMVLELVDDVFSELSVASPKKPAVDWESRSTALVSSVNVPYLTMATYRDLFEYGLKPAEINAEDGGFPRHILSSPQIVSYWSASELSGGETDWALAGQADMPPVASAKLSRRYETSEAVFTIPFDVNRGEGLKVGAEILFVRPSMDTVDKMTLIRPSGTGPVAGDYETNSTVAPQDAIGAAAMAMDDSRKADGNLSVQYREEVARITAVAENGDVTVSRGRVGTTPAPLPFGTWAFLLPDQEELHNVAEFTDPGFEVTGRHVPLNGSGQGIVAIDSNPMQSFGRHLLPERPARVTLSADGETAGLGDLLSLETAEDVSVSWSRRNRARDNAYGANVDDPESGVLTFVRLWRRVTIEKPGSGNRMKAVCLHEARGISGTSYVIPADVIASAAAPGNWNNGGITSDIPDFLGAAFAVEVGSHRGDDNSLFNPIVRLDVGRQYPGWGDAYGYSYGGPDRVVA